MYQDSKKGTSHAQRGDASGFNKFDLINTVLVSDLSADDKNLLIELVVRADANGESFPSVERLCQVRGIKHEKNFRGVEAYLPGLVTTAKRGRRNVYFLDIEAIQSLQKNRVSIKHTPSLAGVSAIQGSNTPAVADSTPATAGAYTPAVAENTPAVAGANTTEDNTRDTTKETKSASGKPSALFKDVEQREEGDNLPFANTESLGYITEEPEHSFASTDDGPLGDTAEGDTPSTAGVSVLDEYEQVQIERKLKGNARAREIYDKRSWAPGLEGLSRAVMAVRKAQIERGEP